MNLHLYQIIVPIFSLIMILYACSLFKRGKKTIKELIVWVLFWGMIGYVAFYPEVTNIVAQITGIQNNINAVVFVAFGILFFVVFKLVVIMESQDQRVTQLVRKEALRSLESSHTQPRHPEILRSSTLHSE